MTFLATTYAEVVDHFAGRSAGGARTLRRWEADPHKAQVVPFVRESETRVAYALTPTDIEDVALHTEHALGTIRRSIRDRVPRIRDWHSPFAFEHTLHYALESLGHVPTYQEFRGFCEGAGQAHDMLWGPAQREIAAAADGDADRKKLARQAMQWRVGNAYLSYLRELYVLAVLRESGVDARYHVLADVLFRVDCWEDDNCFSVYIGNPQFRLGGAGRKLDAEKILGRPPFAFGELVLPVIHKHGTVHLPARSTIVTTFASVKATM